MARLQTLGTIAVSLQKIPYQARAMLLRQISRVHPRFLEDEEFQEDRMQAMLLRQTSRVHPRFLADEKFQEIGVFVACFE
ncbi:MAG: hypothetical protein KGZ30_03330 [Anaplasmataceae bacterium]|nr:hypothetical protein [Anaplasmataceae bacterium]MBS3903374.1 hypothetical protein [Anaplasmataceae bacterium]